MPLDLDVLDPSKVGRAKSWRRPEQEAYALAVAESLAEGEVLLADVLTGTTKSLTYLAAAVLGGRPVDVSMATVQLQSKLQTEDALVLSRALALMGGRPREEGFSCGVIKGRDNFLCVRLMWNMASAWSNQDVSS